MHPMWNRIPAPSLRISARRALIAFCAVAMGATLPPAAASAELCVSPGGRGGCYSTIGGAVDAANPNDTIRVAPGTYREDVEIGKPLSLIGAGPANTVIDASGKANAVYIDGIDNSGLANVVVKGFTLKNANFEGILITNASAVTVWDSRVLDNDQSFEPVGPEGLPACPDIPDFETAESFDCGEGIHLSGVDHSTIANNLLEGNAGGILLSDDTGETHDNLVTGNIARNNPYDCGITLASHPAAELTGASAPLGVSSNTIANNESSYNGLAQEGAGAGVGIFDSVSGTVNTGNVVINNRLIGNGLPGVAMHAHVPDQSQNLNDNVIVGNYISGNHADTEDAATPGDTGINVYGASPITGTVISQNIIKNEQIGIAVNTGAQVDAHLNDLQLNGYGVSNLGSGTVDASQNWWGCSGGPGANGCSSVDSTDIATAPALDKPFQSDKH